MYVKRSHTVHAPTVVIGVCVCVSVCVCVWCDMVPVVPQGV